MDVSDVFISVNDFASQLGMVEEENARTANEKLKNKSGIQGFQIHK